MKVEISVPSFVRNLSEELRERAGVEFAPVVELFALELDGVVDDDVILDTLSTAALPVTPDERVAIIRSYREVRTSHTVAECLLPLMDREVAAQAEAHRADPAVIRTVRRRVLRMFLERLAENVTRTLGRGSDKSRDLRPRHEPFCQTLPQEPARRRALAS